MRGWLLDTNVIASLAAPDGSPAVKTWAAAQDENRLYLSVLTLAEYDKGIHQLADEDPRRLRYRENLGAIEARFAGRILGLNDAAVRLWGALSGRIRRDTGRPPPVIDTLLVAIAIVAGLHFVTRNTRDVQHTGASVFNPWKDDPVGFLLTDG